MSILVYIEQDQGKIKGSSLELPVPMPFSILVMRGWTKELY